MNKYDTNRKLVAKNEIGVGTDKRAHFRAYTHVCKHVWMHVCRSGMYRHVYYIFFCSMYVIFTRLYYMMYGLGNVRWHHIMLFYVIMQPLLCRIAFHSTASYNILPCP